MNEEFVPDDTLCLVATVVGEKFHALYFDNFFHVSGVFRVQSKGFFLKPGEGKVGLFPAAGGG
jgi:hypothetical protein